MAVAADVAELFPRTTLRLRAVRDAVQRLEPVSRHSVASRFLLNLAKEALRGLAPQLAAVEPGDDAEDVNRVLRSVLGCAADIHVLLAFVSEPTVGRVPQAIGAPLEELARPVVGRSRMLLYYNWIPSNYTFRREFPKQLRELLLQALLQEVSADEEHWPDAVKAIPRVFAILSLPAAEQANVLLHSALGHEVGHAIAERVKFQPPALPAHLQHYDAWRIVSDWQQELLADAWGVFLLGPAPLLSLIELAPEHAATRRHPCNYLRFTLMADFLSTTRFLGQANPPADLGWLQHRIEKAISEAAPLQPAAAGNSDFALAHSYLLKERQAVVDFVLSRPGSYDRAKWDAEVTADGRHALVSRILHCAPPDSIGHTDEEPHLGSILNAGWAVRHDAATWEEFSSQFGLDKVDREYESLKRLNQLLLKAIEITSIRRDWHQAAS